MLHKYGKYSLLRYSHFYVPAFFSFPSAGILLLFLCDLQIMILIFFFGWLNGDPRTLFIKKME